MKNFINNIYFSRSYHRLAGKTQLYSDYNNDHFHNRLTHTIEVKNIAKMINNKIKNVGKEDFVEAISIAHDLGHTPFGHAGERALNDITFQVDELGGIIVPAFTDKIVFKHNYYSAKSLLSINYNNKRIEMVLAGIILHTNLFYKNYPLTSQEVNSTIKFYLKNYMRRYKVINLINKNPVEAQIVSLADEISQRLSDFHDLLLSKDYWLEPNELKYLLPNRYLNQIEGYPDSFKIKRVIESLTNFYVEGVLYCDKCDSLTMSKQQLDSMDYIKKKVDSMIKNSPTISVFDQKADRIIKTIFVKLYKNSKWIDKKMIDTIVNRIAAISKSYDATDLNRIIPKFNSLIINNKYLLLRKIFKTVHCRNKKFISSLSSKDLILLKEINSEYVYSIIFYIANMTDRFAKEKYDDIRNFKKSLRILLTSI